MSRAKINIKTNRRARRQEKRNLTLVDDDFIEIAPTAQRRALEPIRALTEAQGHYILSITNNILTFGVGPAGTGKSFVAAALAADWLRDKKIDKIIITRPCVEAGESLGFLPGTIDEKYAPYIEPFRDILNKRLGVSFVDYLIKHKRIEAKPLAYMRGTTFENAVVILDEAQNTTPTQMKLFLTRIGHNCKVIIDGDIEQKDIKTQSGLSDAIHRLRNIKSVGMVIFDGADVVRSGIVKEIIRAYSE